MWKYKSKADDQNKHYRVRKKTVFVVGYLFCNICRRAIALYCCLPSSVIVCTFQYQKLRLMNHHLTSALSAIALGQNGLTTSLNDPHRVALTG